MKQIEMSEITCKFGTRRLRIPGGWHAWVGEITADPQTITAYKYVLGEEEAHALHQRIYEQGYVRTFRLAVARRAQEYARMYPDRVQEDGTLLGFDSSALQPSYIPFDQPGRAGNPHINQLLREMTVDGPD